MAFDYNKFFNDTPQDKEKKRPKAEDILRSIYTDSAPQPRYNEKLQERKKKVARINTLGRGFGVLGDILSLKTGAPVKRRQPDQTTPAMLKSYQDYIQDYENKMDASRYRDFQQKLANKRLLLSDVYRQEDKDFRDKQFETGEDWKEKQFEESQRRYEDEPERKKEIYDYQHEQRLDQMAKRHEQTMKEIAAREKYYGARSEDKGINIMTNEGMRSFSPERFSYMRNEALRNADLITREYPHLFEEEVQEVYDDDTGEFKDEVAGYTPKRTTTDEDLIRAYLEMIEKRKNWQIPKNWQAPQQKSRPEYKGPIKPKTKQQPAEIDYSNLNF